MRVSSGRQGIRILVVTLLVAVTGFVVTTPTAEASTGGGATAQAVNINLASIAGVFPGLTLLSPVVNAPGTNGTVVDNSIAAPPLGVSLGVITNSATRGPLSTSASSQVASASIDLLGLPLLRTGVINAAVTCPFSGTGTSVASAAGVSVLGTNVSVSNVGVTVNATVAGIADVSATISEVEDPGHASSIVVQVTIDPILLPPVNVGTIVLANATCAAPTAPDAPTATSITPTEGPTAGGTAVTLTGTNFVPGAAVFVGGSAATNVNVVNATTLTFQTPPHAAGVVDVIVTTAGGPATLPFAFTYIPPTPAVTAINPAIGPVAGGTVVTLTGTDFQVGATTVSIGGQPGVNVSVTNGTSLTFETPPTATPGPVDVTVTTAGGTSGPQTFTYFGTPTVTGINPTAGPVVGGNPVVVTGTGFVQGATSISVVTPGNGTIIVPAGGVIVNANGLSVAFPMPDGGTPGTATVTASNPGLPGTGSAAYEYVLPPDALAVAPGRGPAAGGQNVTITGTELANATSVTFDGVAGTIVSNDATVIVVTTPAHVPAVVDVAVTTAGGTDTLTGAFEFVAAPTIATLTPAFGPIAGGTPVTITGTGFETGTTVTFGGVAATNVVIGGGGTTLTMNTPPHAAGAVPVVVTSTGGPSAPSTFTFLPVPTVDTLDPAFGPVAGGTSVNISGSGFVAGQTTVTFGGVAATVNSVAPDGLSMNVTTPPGAAGDVDVIVTTPGGAVTEPDAFTYVPVPTITSVTPPSGSTQGNDSIAITGSGFVAGQTTVTFGGSDGSSVEILDDAHLLVLTPAHAAGLVDVVITTPGGAATLTNGYTFVTPPTITNVDPAFGPTAGGTPVTITGTGFIPGETDVGFGAVPAASVVVVNDTTLNVITPAHAAGTVLVSVTTPGGTNDDRNFTFVPPPTATLLTPADGPTAVGTLVTVTGTGFVSLQTTVTIDGVSVPANVNSATSLTFTAAPHAAGAVPVTVTTPGGTTSPALFFTYRAAPTATSLLPDSGPSTGGQTNVTLTGTGFVDGATTVTFDGAAATDVTVVSATELTLTTPAGAAGPADVVVITAGGPSTPAALYTYFDAPTAATINPPSGPLTGIEATVTGTNFPDGETSVLVVLPDGTPVLILPADVTVGGGGTTVTFDMPASGQTGAAAVSVVTPGGASDAVPFTYLPIPTATDISPDSGPLSGGPIARVSIDGTGFVDGQTTVSFGGSAGTNPVVSNDGTTVSVDPPPHALGAVQVAVTTPGGTTSPTLTYTYVPAPTATAISPDQGPLTGGPEASVAIVGTNFIPGETTVEFDGIPATNVEVTNGGTTISADPPAADAPGDVDVVVSTPGGETAPPLTYTYVVAPTASSITPTAGPSSGGTPVTIAGTNFMVGETNVLFDDIPATNIVVAADGLSLTAVTPPDAAGPAEVVVATPGGETAPLTFTYFDAPTATEISPDSGPLSGGPAGSVSIDGTNFVPGQTIVLFDDEPATNVVVDPSGLFLSADPPAHDAGEVDVIVATPGGETDPPLAYTYVPAPTAATIDPTSGPGAGGTPVTIIGTNFIVGETAVLFDEIPATNVVVASPTSLTAVTPPDAAGPADVIVVTPGGESDPPLTFTYQTLPTASGVAPVAGPLAGGNTVTVSGTDLVAGATTVTVQPPGGGAPVTIPATAVTVSPDGTTASFVMPGSTTPGDAAITLTTPFGTTAPVAYEYLPVPTAASLLPDAFGPTAGGNSVTIVGTGFVAGATSVQIGSNTIPASQVSVVGGGQTPLTGALTQALQASLVQSLTATGTTVTFVAPANVAGPVAVTVITPGGTSTPALTYTYVPPPTAASLSPTFGPASGGTIITITGSGFVPGATTVIVTLPNGQVVTIPPSGLGIREDGTALSLFSPASGVAGVATIRVVTPGGETIALSFRYTVQGLPATGSDSTSLLAAAVVLLAAGSALLAASRRRSRRVAGS